MKKPTISPLALVPLEINIIEVLLCINEQLGGEERRRIDYGRIAERLGVHWRTVSNTVDKLIERGLVSANGEGLAINPDVIIYVDVDIA